MVSMYKNPLENLEDWPEKSQAAMKESYGLQWIKIRNKWLENVHIKSNVDQNI